MLQRMSTVEIESLARQYDLRVRGVVPMRSVAGLITDQGKWICKRYDETKGIEMSRLLAIVDLKEQMADQGLCRSYRRTKDDDAVCLVGKSAFTVEPWIPGRHADFSNQMERLEAVRAVARLHRVTVSVKPVLKQLPTLSDKLRYRLDRAQQIVWRGEFVSLTPRQWEVWRRRADDVLHRLEQEQWQKLNEHDRLQGIICHRDLASHNILVRTGVPAHLIDFDLAGIDTPLYDLHQLLDHMRFSAGLDSNWWEEVLAAYARIAPLSSAHISHLHALAAFPSILLREIIESGDCHDAVTCRKRAVRVRFAQALEEKRLMLGT